MPVGFRGCIKKLNVNGKQYNLRYPGPDVKEQQAVLPTCGTSPCVSIPCKNGGTCVITSAKTFQCRCPLGSKGLRCETRGKFPLEFIHPRSNSSQNC